MAVFAVADTIRQESRDTIHALHARGIEVAMLTGDPRGSPQFRSGISPDARARA